MEGRVVGLTHGPLCVLVHGWPDTGAMWDTVVASLQSRYRLLVVTLPHSRVDPAAAPVALGPTWAQMQTDFDALVERHRGPQERVCVISHDWGTVLAHRYEQQHGAARVKAMVTLDVGFTLEVRPRIALGTRVAILAYQLLLIAALLVYTYVPGGRVVGNAVCQAFAWLLNAPRRRDTTVPAVCAAQAFLYFRFWADLIARRSRPPRRFPEVPTLFVFGERKPFHFHTPALLTHLNARDDGSKAVGIATGHWVTEKPHLLLPLLEPFLAHVFA